MSVWVLTVFTEPLEGGREPNVSVLGVYSTELAARSAAQLAESVIKSVNVYDGKPHFDIKEWYPDLGPAS